MVEHREGQTQPNEPTVEHSAEEPQTTSEELASDMIPTDGALSLPETSTMRQPAVALLLITQALRRVSKRCAQSTAWNREDGAKKEVFPEQLRR